MVTNKKYTRNFRRTNEMVIRCLCKQSYTSFSLQNLSICNESSEKIYANRIFNELNI